MLETERREMSEKTRELMKYQDQHAQDQEKIERLQSEVSELNADSVIVESVVPTSPITLQRANEYVSVSTFLQLKQYTENLTTSIESLQEVVSANSDELVVIKERSGDWTLINNVTDLQINVTELDSRLTNLEASLGAADDLDFEASLELLTPKTEDGEDELQEPAEEETENKFDFDNLL